MNDQELLLELADRLTGRWFGKYRGTVTDVDSGTLRIKASVPAVLGEQHTGWCLPCVPYAGQDVGFFFVPDVGAAVWIEFEGGDVSYPIWTGCFWRSGELPSDAAPTTRGVVTAAAHKLLFDDDAESVTLTDPNDNTMTLDSSGLTTAHGSMHVVVSDSSVNVNDGALEVT